MKNKEFLKVEYEQTIQTLRNWDTLFFNAFSSIFIGGGLGSFAVFLGKEEVGNFQIKLVLFALLTSIFIVLVLYLLYYIFVAQKKFKVLKKIEKKMGMVGAYEVSGGNTKKLLLYFIFPILTAIYLVSLGLIQYAMF